jgi:hypothetical protein
MQTKEFYLYKYFIIIISLAALISCDNRNSVSRSRVESTYSCDITAVKDYSQRKNIVNLRFWRDNTLFERALIAVNGGVLPSIGGGTYFGQTPTILLVGGNNQISFADTEKTYNQSITFDLPDSFGVSYIQDRFPRDAVNNQVNWSPSNRANYYILSVASRGYPADGTTAFTKIFDSSVNSFIIPDTVFENISGFTVNGTYLIYMVAYKDGFGEYPGMQFYLPTGLPQRRVVEPAGYIRYGIVAPVDSIVVQP